MKAQRFIADRIVKRDTLKGSISQPIVKIGVIGIALGICVMLLSVFIVLGFKKEIVRRITSLSSHLTITNLNSDEGNEALPLRFSSDSLQKASQLEGVRQIIPVGLRNGILSTKEENEGVVVKGVPKGFNFEFLKDHLLKGRIITFKAEEVSKDILISQRLASKLNLDTGSRMKVFFIVNRQITDSVTGETMQQAEPRSWTFKVCGVFKTDFIDFDEQLCLVDLRQLQRLCYWDSLTCGAYEVQLEDISKTEISRNQLEDYFGMQANVASVREQYYNLFAWLDKLDINGVILVVLMVIVATFNMITALLILILERTNMIGMLKALGMSNASVRGVFLQLSRRLVLRGILYGNIATLLLYFIQTEFGIVRLDPETYYVDRVMLSFDWFYFALLNTGTFVVCMAMLLFPAMLIARLTPVKTLKFD